MSYTNCPVCRRVKGIDDLVCPACWAKVDEGTKQHRDLFARQHDNPSAYRKLVDMNRQIVARLKDERAAGKPFGYDVEIRCLAEPRYRSFHWQGDETTMRRKARLQSTFMEIVSMKPLTRSQWVQAYGLGRM